MATQDNRKEAESHTHGSLLGCATDCHNQVCRGGGAKKGVISRREFVKLYIVTDVKGRKIISRAVTMRRAHDSPMFRKMNKGIHDCIECVMLDAGYDAHKNYKMIHDTDRRPWFVPTKTA